MLLDKKNKSIFFSFYFVISIIVNDLISVDVVCLPEIVFVGVEETVGVVLELDALD